MKSFVLAALVTLSAAPERMSDQDKLKFTRPVEQVFYTCVAEAIETDVRYGRAPLNDLVLYAVENPCLMHARAAVAVHDHYFGDGAGVRFFEKYLEHAVSTASAMLKHR